MWHINKAVRYAIAASGLLMRTVHKSYENDSNAPTQHQNESKTIQRDKRARKLQFRKQWYSGLFWLYWSVPGAMTALGFDSGASLRHTLVNVESTWIHRLLTSLSTCS